MQARKREAQEAPPERLKPSVARGLAEAFSGFEIVDRDLDLGDNRRVDWVGVDSTGRLVLVLAVDGDGTEPLIAAVDALAFVARNRGVLAGHLQTTKLRPEASPVVVLVAEGFSERLLGRLSSLNGDLVRLFEVRTVTSARGEQAYLAPIQPAPAHASMIPPRSSDVFLRELPAPQRELAELVLKRIARIDDQLTSAASEKAITWRWNGDVMCSLSSLDDRLEGQVQPDGRAVRIASVGDVEAFVDGALQRYVELLGAPARPHESHPGLTAVEPSALLSTEELEAFRQPG